MNTTTVLPVGLIIEGEPIRYKDSARWLWNNGFRRRWLWLGAAHAAVINAARRGDAAAVERHARTLGGLTQTRTFVKSALRIGSRLEADLPPYRIEDGVVLSPRLHWRWSGRCLRRRQVAKIEWYPLWGCRRAAK